MEDEEGSLETPFPYVYGAVFKRAWEYSTPLGVHFWSFWGCLGSIFGCFVGSQGSWMLDEEGSLATPDVPAALLLGVYCRFALFIVGLHCLL